VHQVGSFKDKYTEMHGQQNIKKIYANLFRSIAHKLKVKCTIQSKLHHLRMQWAIIFKNVIQNIQNPIKIISYAFQRRRNWEVGV